MYSNQMDSAQRIKAIDPGMAKGKAKELLDAVVKKYGAAPNSFKTMAHSPAVLQGFLGLSATLEGSVLPFETRYQIAITVSELNGCPYCLSAFTAIGKGAGMKDETLAACRIAGSTDPKIDAMLYRSRPRPLQWLVRPRFTFAEPFLDGPPHATSLDEMQDGRAQRDERDRPDGIEHLSGFWVWLVDIGCGR